MFKTFVSNLKIAGLKGLKFGRRMDQNGFLEDKNQSKKKEEFYKHLSEKPGTIIFFKIALIVRRRKESSYQFKNNLAKL